jgi:methylmalonyl-CoA mutase
LAGPLFQTPEEAADMAVKSQVNVVGMSSLAAGHKTLAPQLVKALKERGAEHIVVVVGGVIPRQDYDFLLQNGVSAVFGPGTNVLEAARAIIDLMQGKLRNQ